MSRGVDRLEKVIEKLRSQEGCPWDRAQTIESLKPRIIEEASEVLAGINILLEKNDPYSLKEELGDLLFQIVMISRIAQEKGLFTLDDVGDCISDKMIHRHPHVYGKPILREDGSEVTDWEEIKRYEKAGHEWVEDYLPRAWEESRELIDVAVERKLKNNRERKI